MLTARPEDIAIDPGGQSVAWRSRSREWLDCALAFMLTATVAASWGTHIGYCVTHDLWARLVVGLLLFPVSILHGLAVLVSTWA